MSKRKSANFVRLYVHRGLLIGLCILAIITGWTLTNSRHVNPGWQYVFQEKILLSEAFPQLYHSLTIDPTSLYINTTNGFTYSLNRFSGGLNWRHEEQEASIYPAVFGDDDRMFLTNFDGRLYVVNARSGKEIWRFTTPGLYMSDTEPTVSEGIVYFGSRNGSFYALNAQTGALLWTFQTTPVTATGVFSYEPILHFGRYVIDDKNVYIVSSTDKTIYALNKKTGESRWQFALYGFLFQNPTIFPTSISFWDVDGTYYIVDKQSGSTIYSTSISQNNVFHGALNTYLIDSNNFVESIDTKTGALRWTYQNPNVTLKLAKETDSNHVIITGNQNKSTTVTLVDTDRGDVKWTKTLSVDHAQIILTNAKNIFVIGGTMACSLTYQGNIVWCIHNNPNVSSAFLGDRELFLVSDTNNLKIISNINLENGSPRWLYRSTNVNIPSIQEYDDNLYFVSKDTRSVVMLNGRYAKNILHASNIKQITNTIHGPTWMDYALETFTNDFAALRSYVSHTRNTVIIERTPSSVGVNDVYDVTIHEDESQFINKYDDADISGIFVDNKGKPYRVRAFYYDKNTWKVRFAPPSTGPWKWTINASSISQTSSFIANTSNNPGFLSVSRSDPREFVLPDGNIFTPIGIQDCTQDVNQDGDPLNQWFLGTEPKPPTNLISFPTVSMDDYLSTYATSGFNLFRWGAGNCGVPLWKTLYPFGNKYALNEGVFTDLLFSSLRDHGYHVWMSLFSFRLPITASLSTAEKQNIIKRYLDYVVNRYAGYVDVWELANEIRLDDSLTNFMSTYIRSIDPYHHPITINWERPELSSIDLASIHWYSNQNYKQDQTELIKKIDIYKKIGKPVVFSEQGNQSSNWDSESATRMRVRLWTGFFNKMFYVFWNTSDTLFVAQPGTPANLYIGPTERQYISVFRTFVDTATTKLTYRSVTASGGTAFAMDTGEQKILGYIYRTEENPELSSSALSMDIPSEGAIRWVSPTTGLTLGEQPVQKGAQLLKSPNFSTDIAFIISLQ